MTKRWIFRIAARGVPAPALGVLLLTAAGTGGADGGARDAAAARREAARPLLAAVATGDRAELARLLQSGADPDASDASGWTALHEAAARSDAASLRLLLRAGARPDRRARAGGTPLDVAEAAGGHEAARLLRQGGARGSGKSIGDTVCVRPWAGGGYCARVLGRDATRFELLVLELVGCAGGCSPDAACSAGRVVGPRGLAAGDQLLVPGSCLTDTGVR